MDPRVKPEDDIPMPSAAQEQTWRNQLLSEQAEERTTNEETTTRASAPTEPPPHPAEKLTLQLMLRPLFADVVTTLGIGSFGLSWICLFLYTLVKDLTRFRFMADPGDALFLFMPADTITRLPAQVRQAPRLLARLFIYPIGGLMILALLGAVTLLIMVIYAYLNPTEIIGRLLGF